MENFFFINYVFFFILGALLGSLANVLIVRLPQGESFLISRSRCLKCKSVIRWYDNIPIFSWFILKGRCRQCGSSFSFRYPLVECLMAAIFLLIYLKFQNSWLQLEYSVFCFALVVGSFIDFDHMILPDEITLSGILLGLLGAWINPERDFLSAFMGVILGGGFLWLIACIYYLLRKEEGIGGGDIKLLAWIGAVLGWLAIPLVILVASLVGSFVGILVSLRSSQGMKTAIPFGPYLALGAVCYIFLKDFFGHWYWRFLIPSFTWE